MTSQLTSLPPRSFKCLLYDMCLILFTVVFAPTDYLSLGPRLSLDSSICLCAQYTRIVRTLATSHSRGDFESYSPRLFHLVSLASSFSSHLPYATESVGQRLSTQSLCASCPSSLPRHLAWLLRPPLSRLAPSSSLLVVTFSWSPQTLYFRMDAKLKPPIFQAYASAYTSPASHCLLFAAAACQPKPLAAEVTLTTCLRGRNPVSDRACAAAQTRRLLARCQALPLARCQTH